MSLIGKATAYSFRQREVLFEGGVEWSVESGVIRDNCIMGLHALLKQLELLR